MSINNLDLYSSAEDWAKAYPQYAGLLSAFMNNGDGAKSSQQSQQPGALQSSLNQSQQTSSQSPQPPGALQSSLNQSQQSSSQSPQPQQKYQIKDSTGQPINAMIDTSYLDPNDPQYHQIMAHNTAIANQQKQAQQQAQPQQQQGQQSQLQQYLQQQQLELLANQKRQMEDAQSRANTQVLSSFGESDADYAARVKAQQNPEEAQKAGQQYQQTLTGLMTGANAQQTAQQAKENDLDGALASKGIIRNPDGSITNTITGAVIDANGQLLSPPQSKGTGAAGGKIVPAQTVSKLGVNKTAYDEINNFRNVLDASKSILNPGTDNPIENVLGQTKSGAEVGLAKAGISGDPTATNLTNAALTLSTALTPAVGGNMRGVALLNHINEIVGNPGKYPYSTLSQDLNRLKELVQTGHNSTIDSLTQAGYNTSNFEKDLSKGTNQENQSNVFNSMDELNNTPGLTKGTMVTVAGKKFRIK